LALDGGEWSVPSHGGFSSGNHRTGGWVGDINGWKKRRKFLAVTGLEIRPLCLPVRSQSL
jgi:hypothetical protein